MSAFTEAKGQRLLDEDRTLLLSKVDALTFDVLGDSGATYRVTVGLDHNNDFYEHCACRSRVSCSHIAAAWSYVARHGDEVA